MVNFPGIPNRVPVHSYVAYRCPIGWALSDNPNVEPYKKAVCQPDTGEFDGLDEWPVCFNPDDVAGKKTKPELLPRRVH